MQDQKPGVRVYGIASYSYTLNHRTRLSESFFFSSSSSQAGGQAEPKDQKNKSVPIISHLPLLSLSNLLSCVQYHSWKY